MKKKIILIALLISLSVGAGYMLAAPKHPNLQAALQDLRAASAY